MKLKLVVVSMSVLGMISCPFAMAATQTTTTTKHKHHHHKAVAAAPVVYKGERVYKGEEVAAPVINDWYNRIIVDGGINFDAKWGNRSLGYEGENNQRLSLNDVHLNVTAPINDWVKAFASLSYDNASQTLPGANLAANSLFLATQPYVRPATGVYDNIKDNIGGVVIEQGYIRFENANQLPVYMVLGKQFVDFGKYNLHPITQPLTQVMSETLRNAVTVGFNTALSSPNIGVFGSLYGFDNQYTRGVSTLAPAGTTVSSGQKMNYGAQLGVGQTNDSFTWDLSADYMYNMIGVEGIAYAVGIFNGSNLAANVGNNGVATGGTYQNKVSGFALNADLKTGPFDVELRYVSALQNFSVYDLSKNVYSTATLGAGQGAKPWTAGINAGYAFNAWEKNQDVYLGYEASGNAVNLFLPQSRWLLGYGVDVLKNTNVGLEWDHDIAYGVSKGGSGNSSNQVGLRVGVKFG